jgi:chromate reductase
MKKIIILNCTNRANSNTLKISKLYEALLKEKNIEAEIFEFSALPETIVFTELYGNRTANYAELIEKIVSRNTNFIFVVPEYNGGFPGILKVFLDSIHPKEWANKKACLVGVSTGRAGNLRGMDQLAAILHYLKMHVYHTKLPISLVDKILDEQGHFLSEDQKKVSIAQLEGFLSF